MVSIVCCSMKRSNAFTSNRNARPTLTQGKLPQPGLLVDRVHLQAQVPGSLLDIQEPLTDDSIRTHFLFNSHRWSPLVRTGIDICVDALRAGQPKLCRDRLSRVTGAHNLMPDGFDMIGPPIPAVFRFAMWRSPFIGLAPDKVILCLH